MEGQCVISREITVAAGPFAAGHLGELTQVLDFALVDAVARETGTVQRRVRLLPTRVVIFFVLALALFEGCAYRQVWGKLVAGLEGLPLRWPSGSALTKARRRVGVAPLRALFEAVAGPVAAPGTRGVFWRGLRLVALDATGVHVPDSRRMGARYRKRSGQVRTFGYPLLRLTVVVECGTRALLGAVFGPERDGEVVYGRRLVDVVGAGMLLLADAGYDSWRFMADVVAGGGEFLCRGSAGRFPLILHRLPDGSYVSVVGYGRVRVRIVEAQVTVAYADGVVRTEQWRLLTSLLDHTRYPAGELVDLYHRRWQVETAYASIKSTMLDGRVLRSDRPEDIDQEVWALLAVYQAVVRLAGDALTVCPSVDPSRFSFTIALETARDQVVTARNLFPPVPVPPAGAIATAVLAALVPVRPLRVKARSRKNAYSKYQMNAGKYPQQTLGYTVTAQVMIFEEGLTARQRH